MAYGKSLQLGITSANGGRKRKWRQPGLAGVVMLAKAVALAKQSAWQSLAAAGMALALAGLWRKLNNLAA